MGSEKRWPNLTLSSIGCGRAVIFVVRCCAVWHVTKHIEIHRMIWHGGPLMCIMLK